MCMGVCVRAFILPAVSTESCQASGLMVLGSSLIGRVYNISERCLSVWVAGADVRRHSSSHALSLGVQCTQWTRLPETCAYFSPQSRQGGWFQVQFKGSAR